MNRPDWDNQFTETEDERNERLAAARKLRALKERSPAGLFCRDPHKCVESGRCPYDPVCGN